MKRRTRPSKRQLQGDLRLMHDLVVMHVVMKGQRRPAWERVELQVGPELTQALRAALAEPATRAA